MDKGFYEGVWREGLKTKLKEGWGGFIKGFERRYEFTQEGFDKMNLDKVGWVKGKEFVWTRVWVLTIYVL